VLVLGDKLFYLMTILTSNSIFLLLPQISGAEYKLVQNVQEHGNLLSKIAQSPDKVQVSFSCWLLVYSVNKIKLITFLASKCNVHCIFPPHLPV